MGVEYAVDVVVTNHNYSEFLACALESVRCQAKSVIGQTIVVDDASDSSDSAREICQQQSIAYVRTDFGSPHLARGVGFALSSSPLVCFLDADNYLSPDYLSEAVRLFQSDSRIAIVYPDLSRFGDGTDTFRTPEFDRARLEQENFIDTGSVWLRDAVEQVSLFELDVNGWEDWWSARRIMRSAPWAALKNSSVLKYRIHSRQRTRSNRDKSYFSRAQLATEVVTVFLVVSDLSQRGVEAFSRQKEWLVTQTWPRKQVRILIANKSHGALPVEWLEGLNGFSGLSWYEHFQGESDRLNSANRGSSRPTEAAVYNRMFSEVSTEFVLALGSNLRPEPPSAIEQLLRAFDVRVCAVSADVNAFIQLDSRLKSNRTGTERSGIEDVEAVGFQCLLLRCSQVEDEVIKGTKGSEVQTDWFCRLNARGRICRVNWSVHCQQC